MPYSVYLLCKEHMHCTVGTGGLPVQWCPEGSGPEPLGLCGGVHREASWGPAPQTAAQTCRAATEDEPGRCTDALLAARPASVRAPAAGHGEYTLEGKGVNLT
jgi:hypothetical protein